MSSLIIIYVKPGIIALITSTLCQSTFLLFIIVAVLNGSHIIVFDDVHAQENVSHDGRYCPHHAAIVPYDFAYL